MPDVLPERRWRADGRALDQHHGQDVELDDRGRGGGWVSWPNVSFLVSVVGSSRTITSTDLPTAPTTGTFPVASIDPSAACDRNPNRIAAPTVKWSLRANPTAAKKASCTSRGPIGVLTDGVLLYNALDGEGRDAVAHEVLDSCAGHADMSSTCRHHDVPPCVLSATGRSTLVG